MQSTYHDPSLSFLKPIFRVLSTRRYLGISSAFGLAYAFGYMVLVGIISYVPGLTSASGVYPMVRFTTSGIAVIPSSDIGFFILYEALAFLVTSSFLVGLNVALLFYSRRRTCEMAGHKHSRGLLGLLPAFFTNFACCGGGMIALVAGPAAFSYLSTYGPYLAPLTVTALAAGTYFTVKNIHRMER